MERVDLDDVGPEIGEHHRSPGSGDREPEVEHADARERRRGRGRVRRCRRCNGRGANEPVGLGSYRVAVGADGGRRGRRRRRARVQLVHAPDLADGAERGVDHIGDAAVGQKGGIVQRLLG